MTPNRHLGCVKQSDLVRLPVLALPFTAKDPVPPADLVEVRIFYPSTGFVWVPAFCPLLECQEDRIVHLGKGLFACHMPVKVGPPSNDWVELSNQVARGGLRVGLYDPSYLP